MENEKLDEFKAAVLARFPDFDVTSVPDNDLKKWQDLVIISFCGALLSDNLEIICQKPQSECNMPQTNFEICGITHS